MTKLIPVAFTFFPIFIVSIRVAVAFKATCRFLRSLCGHKKALAALSLTPFLLIV